MTDLTKTIAPKTDRLNADDLIGRASMDITITKVMLSGEADQPVALSFEGDGGKPWYPCKSMRRVLVQVWGGDGSAYTGRRLRLYRDPEVLFGGLKVGGIRISHMSHIDRDVTMALTASKASRKPFTVKPLPTAQEPRQQPSEPTGGQTASPSAPPAGDLATRVNGVCGALARASTQIEIDTVWKRAERLREDCASEPDLLEQLNDGKAAAERLLGQEAY